MINFWYTHRQRLKVVEHAHGFDYSSVPKAKKEMKAALGLPPTVMADKPTNLFLNLKC